MIFVNGCSFSETQKNHNNPMWKPWSDYLCDVYSPHGQFFNTALSSNGQGKILDTTIEGIESYQGKIEMAIIQFSAISRGYGKTYNDFVAQVIESTNYQALLHQEEYMLDSTGGVTSLTKYIDMLYYKSSLCKIIAIKNYLENKKIPYLFFWGWQQITEEICKDPAINSLLKKCYDGNWWRFGEHGGLSEWGIHQFGKDAAILPEDFHPTTLVHSSFWETIIKPIILKNNIRISDTI